MPTYLTYPDQYNAAYFEIDASGLYHDAGYTDYTRQGRWYRTDLGTFPEESATRLQADNTYTPVTMWDDLIARISGRFINADYLELGCAYGYLGEAALAAGLDWTGLDNMYCYNRALEEAPTAAAHMVQAQEPWATSHPDGVDALTYLEAQSPNSIQCIISRWFIAGLDPAYLVDLVAAMNRASRDQIHIIRTRVNNAWYTELTLQEWLDNYSWGQGTILVPNNDLRPEAALIK